MPLLQAILRVLILMSLDLACTRAMADESMHQSSKYRVFIPHFILEYEVPANLRRGYGPQRNIITFDDSTSSGTPAAFGDSAQEKTIATFYYGGTRDDFDMIIRVVVIKFSGGTKTMKSDDLLASYITSILSKKLVVASGKSISNFGKMDKIDVSGSEILRATAADMYHIREVRLSAKQETTLQPYQWYLKRLDSEITVGIHVEHFSEHVLSPKWHSDAEALALTIISSFRLTSVPASH